MLNLGHIKVLSLIKVLEVELLYCVYEDVLILYIWVALLLFMFIQAHVIIQVINVVLYYAWTYRLINNVAIGIYQRNEF